jgi:hypothetical protein
MNQSNEVAIFGSKVSVHTTGILTQTHNQKKASNVTLSSGCGAAIEVMNRLAQGRAGTYLPSSLLLCGADCICYLSTASPLQ